MFIVFIEGHSKKIKKISLKKSPNLYWNYVGWCGIFIFFSFYSFRHTLSQWFKWPTFLKYIYFSHTSKINNLCSRLNSKEMLQYLLYFNKKKTHVVFSSFNSSNFNFFPGLWRQRPGHSAGKQLKLLKMKNGKKNYVGSLIKE